MEFINKNYLIVGMQASGISSANLLKKLGANVDTYDDNIAVNKLKPKTELLQNTDYIILSPSIPNNHEIVEIANSKKIPILSEFELGCQLLDVPKIVVTGTNGKTTTVGMIEKILNNMGLRVKSMGNIGYPITQVILDETILDYAIIEASSFQLERVFEFHSKIAIILNFAPDHMDRYSSYKEYITAKLNVFKNQENKDFAILNYDQKELQDIAPKLLSEIKWVSSKESVGDFYVKDNYYYHLGLPLVNVRDSKVRGDHNKFNMMVAMNVASILGAKKENYINLVREFTLLPHRVEYVGTIDNKSYYNDSKGTNISACKSAIAMLEGNIVLIMGGSDKKEEYCDFFDELDTRVKYVIVTGANASKIINSAQKVGFQDIIETATLKDAVCLASSNIDINNILFSPACASFDKYKNYSERGDAFKSLVYEIKA